MKRECDHGHPRQREQRVPRSWGRKNTGRTRDGRQAHLAGADSTGQGAGLAREGLA